MRAIQAGLQDPRLALDYLELGAKLEGEIGRSAPGSMRDHAAVIVVGAGAEAIAAFHAAAAKLRQIDPTDQ